MKLRIADFYIDVACDENVIEYLPNLRPFIVAKEEVNEPVICRVETGDCGIYQNESAPVYTGFLEGRTIRLWLTPDSCCFLLTFGENSYCLQADRRWTRVKTNWKSGTLESYVALNDIIMLSFVYSAAFYDTAIIHASCIAIGRNGCAFVGPSSVGKSTQSSLWEQYIPGSRLLNDDQPIIRFMADDGVYLYGSPWSGKTPCYHNESVCLKCLFFMEQADENKIVRLSGIETFQKLLKSTSLIGRDTYSFDKISKTQAKVASCVPAFLFRNLKGKEAADLGYKTFVHCVQ